MEVHATKQQQEPNNDKTTSWKKIPYGLVRENTSGVTLFTLLFRGIGVHFNQPFFRFCTFSLYPRVQKFNHTGYSLVIKHFDIENCERGRERPNFL